MNDKLWKIIQFGSFSLLILIGVYSIATLPRTPKPGGGWHVTFPSVTYQVVGFSLVVLLTLTWVFATYVRRQGEVSVKAVQSTILFLVGFGIFFWILQLI
ncbi:hypothetical protein SAMN05216238_1217 [Lentibacillus persicus]|uniref:DUF1648 domain-containing protein n=1 Tax=Lentibacillus persicus TaxID=640948 RepID=A0A1I2B2G8_9BACI|nr:hypothetical protein [Lentibacillus persicus]SFE50382.1 hypothetical protein SAMN05216238_1217 [Lentibacillus persicus]